MKRAFRTAVTILLVVVYVPSTAFAEADKPPGFSSYKSIVLNGGPVFLDPQLRFRLISDQQRVEETLLQEENFGDEMLELQCGKFTVDVGFSHGPSEGS